MSAMADYRILEVFMLIDNKPVPVTLRVGNPIYELSDGTEVHAVCFQRANGTLGKTTLWTPEYIEQLETVSSDYVETVKLADSDVKGATSDSLPIESEPPSEPIAETSTG